MIYILSWILPFLVAVGTVREFDFITEWYLKYPLNILLTLLYRDSFIHIYGTHVTYSFKVMSKEDEDVQ